MRIILLISALAIKAPPPHAPPPVPQGCTADSQCGTGMRCVNNACLPDPDAQSKCKNDQDCPDGKSCTDGKCVAS